MTYSSSRPVAPAGAAAGPAARPLRRPATAPAEPAVAVADSGQIAVPASVYRSEQGLLAPRTRQRYQQVQELLGQGATIRAISRELGLARGTVRRFTRASSVDELL